jgi:hypothetical protein
MHGVFAVDEGCDCAPLDDPRNGTGFTAGAWFIISFSFWPGIADLCTPPASD